MEKCVFDVQQIQGPKAYSSHRQEKMNESHLGNRRKSVIVFEAIYLSMPLGNQTSFNTIHSTIRTNLNNINLTTTNRGLVSR